MILLLLMMISQFYASEGKVIQDYPYFSHEVGISNKKQETSKGIGMRPKMYQNLMHTFDPAAIRALREHIWIDHK